MAAELWRNLSLLKLILTSYRLYSEYIVIFNKEQGANPDGFHLLTLIWEVVPSSAFGLLWKRDGKNIRLFCPRLSWHQGWCYQTLTSDILRKQSLTSSGQFVGGKSCFSDEMWRILKIKAVKSGIVHHYNQLKVSVWATTYFIRNKFYSFGKFLTSELFLTPDGSFTGKIYIIRYIYVILYI